MTSLFHILTAPTFVFKTFVPNWLIENYNIFVIAATLYPLMINMYPTQLTITTDTKLLKFILCLWNLKLALFSIITVYKLTPPILNRLYYEGYHETVCLTNQESSYLHQPYGRWVFLFILSKITEFGDTLFLLLRNKKVHFLHWYHHLITLLFSYVQCILLLETFEWVTYMNVIVHSFMYTYYAIHIYKPSYVKQFSTCITTIQVMQMFHGMFITSYHILYCNGVKDYPGFILYSIYAYLFSEYFIKRYLPKLSLPSYHKLE